MERPLRLGVLSILVAAGIAGLPDASAQVNPYLNPMIAAGGAPRELSEADLDGNGVADLVLVTAQPNGLGILLGLPFGGYGPLISLSAGGEPVNIAISDVSNDGVLDLIAADFGTSSVKVLLGTGGGTYVPAVSYPTNGPCVAITAGEFNGDGKRDIATGNVAPNNLSVLAGNGAGAFGSPKAIFAVGAVNQIATADFDNDGDGDLCYSIQTSSWVWVLTNTGHTNFSQTGMLPTGQTPGDITIADHNLDGRVDLVVNATSGSPATSLGVMLGSPAGFQPTQYVPLSHGVSPSLDVRDANGDGRLDLVTCPQGKIAIYYGNGTGTFNTSIVSSVPFVANDIVLLDATGDGVLDGVQMSNYGGGVFITKGKATGGFEELPKYLTNGLVSRISVAGDFDLDGAPDLAVANYGIGSVSMMRGLGDGSFTAGVIYTPGLSVNDVDVSDFNQDGLLDIGACCETGASQGLVVMLGNGVGTFGLLPPNTITEFPWAGEVRDFNEDGKVDYLTINLGTNDVAILLGTGGGGFAPAVKYASGTNLARALTAGDWNSDGHVDIALGSNMDSNLRLLHGDGLGSLGTPAILPATSTSAGIASEDVDADGLDDLLVTGSAGVVVLKGNGASGFTPIPVAGFPTKSMAHVRTTDVDGNGFVDVLACQAEEIFVALAVQPGSWALPVGYAAGTGSTSSFATHDVNLDGRQDLVSVPLYAGAIFPLLNQLGIPAGGQIHGTGTWGCHGQAAVNTYGDPQIGNNAFGLTTSNAPPNALGLLLVGNSALPVGTDLFQIGLTFLVDVLGSTELLAFDTVSEGSGVGHCGAPIPFIPALVGQTYVAQSIWVEPSSAQCSTALAGLVSSKALLFSILP